MISIGHNITNAFVQYGLDQLLLKNVINANINNTRKSDIEICYSNSIKGEGRIQVQILPNEFKPDITGYLLFSNKKVPLFELPLKLIFRINRIIISKVGVYRISHRKRES